MGIFKKKKKEDDLTFQGTPFLMNFKPKERYVFHSDYFEIDGYFATIMSFFHDLGSQDDFGAFWGINRIASGLGADVTTVNFEQIRRMGEGWIQAHQSKSEGMAQMNANSQEKAGTNATKQKARQSINDLAIIAQELMNGASYLNVHTRIMVKAPSLEELDKAVDKIERQYMDRFGTLHAAPYTGEQRQELSNLLAKNEKKRGKGFYFTSTELAGSYSLVTHGLEDVSGEYVGYMTGDVNNSAVLFDVNDFGHHVVVASEQYDTERGRVHVSDMWGSKASQACMLDNGRVVHLILDDCDLDKLGPKFDNLTYRIDMNHGDVNMFEMFGSHEDELSIFPAQMQKLILMAEQAYETTESDRSVIRGSLESVATKFYIEQRMWAENAIKNRDRLRIVGIPHEEVPTLQIFAAYLDTEYKAITQRTARDEEKVHALSILDSTFNNLLSSNGDLFNTHTSDSIDGVRDGKRVIYDFSQLMMRGRGVAMAQLVNIVGFAVGNLGLNDLVVIHGAELIDPGIRDYVNMQLDRLFNKGGRVAYLYNSMDKLLRDQTFNHFDKADYTIFGNMSDNVVNRYEAALGQAIPPDLKGLITRKDSMVGYIRRGFDNVVFHQDLQLDIPKAVSGGKSRWRLNRKGA